MSLIRFNEEKIAANKYLLNPNVFNINGMKVNRLHIYRLRTFLEELILALDRRFEYNKTIFNEALSLSIKLMGLKKRHKVTLNEIALASLWFVLKRNTISINVIKLIEISRKKLNKKVTRKNILRILSHIRSMTGDEDPKKEILALGFAGIRELMKKEELIKKLSLIGDGDLKASYFMALRKEFIRHLNRLPNHTFSGKPRNSLAAILIYISDKKVSREMNIKPLLSAKELEEIFDICQFTILRNYKNFQ